ncbi:hypothetical protein BDP27DRAFT_1365769 [Rhodocollybia butyracea]|uniref:Uncharacterized protein n=1 Tax=Rhodocollybia butyracea TaxID=206335 RepID=A0A9P5PQP6_9AGAR|nr:hypothetical protein BDP27DRAFT_1365769 [Rhodocollybia butyracea]
MSLTEHTTLLSSSSLETSTTDESEITIAVSTQRTSAMTFEDSNTGDIGHLAVSDLESVFITPTEAPEADLEAYLRLFDGIEVPVIEFSLETMDNLTTAEEYDDFTASQDGTDPLDKRAKKALFGDLDLGWYRTPFNKHRRYLPHEGDLLPISPEFVPQPIRNIRCFSLAHTSLLRFALVTGTLIPAGSNHGRAMVLTPLFQEGRHHFLLCLHGSHDTFLVRANENCMDRKWGTWTQMKKVFGQGSFRALFSAGGKTLEERMNGIVRQQRWYNWEQQALARATIEQTFLAGTWGFFTELCEAGYEGELVDGPWEMRRSLSP